ncbi:leucine--tRNA ligase [Halovenus marina]|uniref:leucine--tRNA ligase n=1 Tax=Halovenus marina TaxID=3396621 RepID=UPI003F5478C7
MSGRNYNHAQVTEYWQYVWNREHAYELDDGAVDPTYVLGMFPYTSGNLHMGHVRNYAITDAYARYRRMQADDVLHPMGWDAFGLPAENAANERFTDPRSWTEACITEMREDMEELGFGYDWSREITTCDPEYYRWNQYFFRKFYEEGLVEYDAAAVNWCPECETVLADAQVVEHDDGDVCWRCETPVGRRELDQWFFTITDYAEELLDGLDDLDGWPESVKEIQRNWIGKREGARVTFEVKEYGDVDVFTTRLDTIFGASYLAVSPGHDLARTLAEEREAVAEYVESARSERETEFSGIRTDLTATNPASGEELPVYVASYVLEDVGTGAVMGVPAHNERDYEFATAQDLPIPQVVEPVDDTPVDIGTAPFTGEGMLTDSGEYDGLASSPARERLLADLDEAREDVTYRLRDWLISRQRYWGTPIPVVHCEECGPVLVPENELPVELPEFVQTRANPLEAATEFVQTTCPECGGEARRETDTMDTFVDSSWYFLRYLSPDRSDVPFDSERANEWLPVDVYVGGEEHAVLHLLYIRFFTRALSDIGLIDFEEPVERLINQGTVLHSGEKMSKTKGNVVSPHEYGAETTRLFVLSAAHPEQDFEWTARDVGSAYDIQQQIYSMVDTFANGIDCRESREPQDEYVAREIDRTIQAVSEEYERVRFHRAVNEIRGLAGLLGQYREYGQPHEAVYRRGLRVLTRLIAPLTPYLGEECWNLLRGDGIVAHAGWPTPEHAVEDYAAQRRIVEQLRDDVREIFEVADLADAAEIEVVVAPDWKFEIYRQAREAEKREAFVGTVMADERMQEVGEPAQSYAAELEDRTQRLPPVLDPAEEFELLDRASWLLDDEFGVDVIVRRAEESDERANKARPGRPAIHVR